MLMYSREYQLFVANAGDFKMFENIKILQFTSYPLFLYFS